MEFFVFIVFLMIVFGILNGEKRAKANSAGQNTQDTSNTRGGQARGMQDDIDPRALYKVSKDRIEAARKSAAEKLVYKGLPTIIPKATLIPKAKNKGRDIAGGLSLSKGQTPLIRDLNLQRRLFLSGGRNNTFGEREKKRLGGKTLLGFVVLGVVLFYLVNASGG